MPSRGLPLIAKTIRFSSAVEFEFGSLKVRRRVGSNLLYVCSVNIREDQSQKVSVVLTTLSLKEGGEEKKKKNQKLVLIQCSYVF